MSGGRNFRFVDLCANFPCQPFSEEGNQLGLKDTTQGNLLFKVHQILKVKRRHILFRENVLENLGYAVEVKRFSLDQFGASHKFPSHALAAYKATPGNAVNSRVVGGIADSILSSAHALAPVAMISNRVRARNQSQHQPKGAIA